MGTNLYCTELCFDHLPFCLVCIGERSSMNLVVSVDVSLVIPSVNKWTLCTFPL